VTTLNAKPEPIEIDLRQAAVVVVDMQNAFASKGGLLDIAGADLSGTTSVIHCIKDILEAARRAGVAVVYLQMGYKPDLSNSGGAGSPNSRKELAMHLMTCRPELRGKLLTEGTWDFEIVDELKPREGDLVVLKTRYSGFAGTTLDSLLRTRGIRYLFLAGIATNVCVESTLRDAYFLDYWPILIADATLQAGPPEMQSATLFNVETFFGWTTGSEDVRRILSATSS
jgi:ureidoacrylate peracid hydrolase